MAKLASKLDREAWAKLDAAVQGFYVERGGSYVLDTDDASELRNALERERKEKAALAAQFEGIDPAEHKRLREAAENAARQSDLDAGRFDKILVEERDKHTKERARLEAQLTGVTTQLRGALVDNEAVRAVAAAEGNPTLLIPHITSRVKLLEVDGRQTAVVTDDRGEPRLRTGATKATEYMGIGDYVGELRGNKDFAGAFKGGRGSGTGSPRGLPPVPAGHGAQRAAEVAQIVTQLQAGNKVLRPA